MSQQLLEPEMDYRQESQSNARQIGGVAEQNLWGRRVAAMQKGFKINTIYDMFKVDYPSVFDDEYMNGLGKAAPIISTTTAAYNEVHGAEAVSWVIQEADAFALIGMEPWRRGGFRAITAAAKTADGGVTENASIPATLKPTLANVDVPIKEVATTYSVSTRQTFYSLQEDDTWSEGGNTFEAQRIYHGLEFNKLINRMLLKDNDTLAAANVESIDRVIASKSEIDGVGQTAGDLDIYGLDRDSVTTHDAYVNHNSGTDRDLEASLIKDLKENAQPKWGGPGEGKPKGTLDNKYWLTGYDTMNRIEQIFESQNTYVNQGARVNITFNGVQTLPYGSDAGFLVNMLYGIPIFVSNDVAKDTLSRLYLIDGDHMHMKMGIPHQHFTAGMMKGTILELGNFQDKGMYYGAMELWADRFNVHAKLRDLQ